MGEVGVIAERYSSKLQCRTLLWCLLKLSKNFSIDIFHYWYSWEGQVQKTPTFSSTTMREKEAVLEQSHALSMEKALMESEAC